MARKKVKFASGLTVRSGDKVLVNHVAKSVANPGTSCITVVKVKRPKVGQDG